MCVVANERCVEKVVHFNDGNDLLFLMNFARYFKVSLIKKAE